MSVLAVTVLVSLVLALIFVLLYAVAGRNDSGPESAALLPLHDEEKRVASVMKPGAGSGGENLKSADHHNP